MLPGLSSNDITNSSVIYLVFFSRMNKQDPERQWEIGMTSKTYDQTIYTRSMIPLDKRLYLHEVYDTTYNFVRDRCEHHQKDIALNVLRNFRYWPNLIKTFCSCSEDGEHYNEEIDLYSMTQDLLKKYQKNVLNNNVIYNNMSIITVTDPRLDLEDNFVSRIKRYNNNLFQYRSSKYNFEEYYTNLHEPFVKNEFVKYFMEISRNPKKFVVPHQKLYKYGIINDFNDLNQVKECLKYMISDEDYILVGSNQYILTQDAFKICLGRSEKSRVYMNYFIRLEKIYFAYNDYSRKYDEKIRAERSSQVDRIQNQMSDILYKLKNR